MTGSHGGGGGGGGHVSRSSASGRPNAVSRNSRSSSSRQQHNNVRTAQHGYIDNTMNEIPAATAHSSSALVDAGSRAMVMGAGGGVGSGVSGVGLGVNANSGAFGVVPRAQIPLPLIPANVQTQQQQQSYYGPRGACLCVWFAANLSRTFMKLSGTLLLSIDEQLPIHTMIFLNTLLTFELF